MRTDLEIEQLGLDPVRVTPRPTRRPKRSLPSIVWIVAAVAAALLGVIAFLVLSSDKEPKQVVAAGASSRSIAVSADGTLLAVGLLDGSLRILNAHSGKTLARQKADKPEQRLPTVAAISFGPPNTVLVLRAGDSKLHIFSHDLQAHTERAVRPNAHDLVWSRALDAALVLTGGGDNLQPKIEVFPARPMGIQKSTAQLWNLINWSKPKHIAVSADGSRLAMSFASTRKQNVLVYDPRARRTASALLIPGEPEGVAFASNGRRLWATSPSLEAISEVGGSSIARTQFPRLASTSPPRMIAVNESRRRAYTTGSLTFPEIDLDQRRITRKVELPERSAGIALSPDGSTAYLTFEKLDIVGVVDLHAMRWVREIKLR